jgi:membrane-bound lytic murein transglycosylase A
VLHLRGDVSIFPGDEPLPPPADGEGEGVLLRAVSFSLLPGWSEDRVDEALPAMERSCRRLLLAPGDREVAPSEIGGRVDDWRDFCNGILALEDADEGTVRSFLETEAVPVAVFEDRRWNGLFTGYYEPLLRGSRRRREPYTVPLYRRPPELVSVDLGDFRDDLAGRRLAGEVVGGRLRPFRSRSRIEEGGALTGRGLELVWVDDPVDAFFLQIQGSGRVRLAEGGTMRVGFAASNGRPFRGIARDLIDMGVLPKDDASMQAVRDWLRANPTQAAELMQKNPRFIFFREIEGPDALTDGPIGAQGVPLTPQRSLAVDTSFLPLGAPLWLDTTWPPGTPDVGKPLRRLMIAQDTGGAIKGPVRGDFFWGTGEAALAQAGGMKQTGRYYLLLPKSMAARRDAAS